MDPQMIMMILQMMNQGGGAGSGGGGFQPAGSDWKKSGIVSPTLAESNWGKSAMKPLRKYTIAGNLGAFGSGSKSPPSPHEIFRKMMKEQYPIVSQSADRLAAMGIREASRGAGAAGMNNSAVLQSIRDASVRGANRAKASARDQMLQQGFDIAGEGMKAEAFKALMQASQGGRGGVNIMQLLQMLMKGGGGSGNYVNPYPNSGIGGRVSVMNA